MGKKRPGVPTDPAGDLLARQVAIVVVPLNYVFPEGLICHYCNERQATTRDHIVPKAKGGVDAWWNLAPACQPCNRKKADDMPEADHCVFCVRAIWLFNKGYVRDRMRHHSLFSIKAAKLPADLSHSAYLERYPVERTAAFDRPKSFDGSV